MNQQDVESVLKKWFKLKPIYCNIEIAGRHFGGRFRENLYKPTNFISGNKILRIYFDKYEHLTIIEPDGVRILNVSDLTIKSAKIIRWGWYYYGSDIKSENWCEHIYQAEEKKIEFFEICQDTIKKKIIEFDGNYIVNIESSNSIE